MVDLTRQPKMLREAAGWDGVYKISTLLQGSDYLIQPTNDNTLEK